jgi:uncharacterized protein YqfA (UPF0365 family)
MPPAQVVILVVFAVFGLFFLLFLLFFARLFRLWLQAFLAGAGISFPILLSMLFRRSPIDEIVRLKIMATQAGLNIPISKIESAALQGADIERAVLALIRAREIGMELTWEEAISKDMSDQLRDRLLSE